MSGYLYKAFITYSHADSKAARRLQGALESYRVPRRLIKNTGVAPRVGTIFLDREELSAGSDLTQAINDSLASSEYLIVVCSPAARRSNWVNLEIGEFRRTHPDENILCYIVDGEPFSTTPQTECLPPALGYLEGDDDPASVTEPVAADSRPGADGQRLARLKLISGLMGIGLNQLIRRDVQRRQRKLLAISLGAGIGMFAMSVLAFFALEARKNEELRRAEAEDLIEFMLSDLRERLDAVGRLDVLEVVGEKAIEYYSKVDLGDHSESSLGRRARAFHLLGEVDELRGKTDEARAVFQLAHQSTARLLAMAPGDGERIYNHAQSVFWLGYLDWQLGSYSEASSAFAEYLVMANRLVELDPNRIEWLGELAYAHTNVGVYALDTQDIEQAKTHFKQAELLFSQVIAREPDSLHWPMQRAQALAWLADSMMYDEPLAVIIDYRKQEIAIYRFLLEQDPGNAEVIGLLVNALYAKADLALDQDQSEDAQRIAGEALGLGRTLVELDPDNTYSLFLLAKVQEQLARIYSNLDERNRVFTLLADAASILHRLLKTDSEVVEWRQLEKQILFDAALAAIVSGEPAPGLGDLSKAVVELGKMKSESPNRKLITLIASGHIALAYGHALVGEAQTAREHFLLATSELESIPGTGLPESRALLADCYRAVGRTAQAQAITHELAQLGFVRPPFFTRQLELGTALSTETY